MAPPATLLVAAGALGSPEHAIPAFPGSNWHAVWPRMDYAPCVVHLGSSWISGSPGVGKARATAAGLRGGASPA